MQKGSRECRNEQAQIAISSYLDGEADEAEQALAQWHLSVCRICNDSWGIWSQDTAHLRQSGHDEQIELVSQAISDQTRLWLKNQLAPTVPSVKPVMRRRHHSPAFMGAVAASLVIMVTIFGALFSTLFAVPSVDDSQPMLSQTVISTGSTATLLKPPPYSTPSLALARPLTIVNRRGSVPTPVQRLYITPPVVGQS